MAWGVLVGGCRGQERGGHVLWLGLFCDAEAHATHLDPFSRALWHPAGHLGEDVVGRRAPAGAHGGGKPLRVVSSPTHQCGKAAAA